MKSTVSRKTEKKIDYIFPLPRCASDNSCSLFIENPNDTYKITLNENILIDESQYYTKFDSLNVVIPSILLKENNFLAIEFKNIHGSEISSEIPKVILDTSYQNRIRVLKKFVIKTGSTLASIHALAILLVLLIAIVFVTKDSRLGVVIIYCISAIFYLISFSEIPRYFFSPELLSGLVHFPLRLIQDLLLFLLFFIFLDNNLKSRKITSYILALYVLVIGSMVIPGIFGQRSFIYHLEIIKMFAPLVAAPMGYCLILSLRIKNNFERKVMIPASVILFLFQLNDLFVFWQLYPGVYTVKIYIPLVIVLLLYIYLVRKIEDFNLKKSLAYKTQLAMQVSHDLKSPIATLEVLLKDARFDDVNDYKMVEEGLRRLGVIADSLIPGFNKDEEFNILEILAGVIDQKNKEHKSANIVLVGDPIFVKMSRSDIERVISNLINNSVEATQNKNAQIKVSLEKINKKIKISLKDNGGGIPEDIVESVGNIGNTKNKKNGSGLGLSYMHDVVKFYNGTYTITNVDDGVTISMILPIIT